MIHKRLISTVSHTRKYIAANVAVQWVSLWANIMKAMREQTETLCVEEARMKKLSGWNTAVTNTVIWVVDLAMLFVSAWLFWNGMVEFEGVVISTLTLMSSFGPVVALAALGSTLQNTFAAGNRVLDILEELPVTEEIKGRETIEFSGAGAEK